MQNRIEPQVNILKHDTLPAFLREYMDVAKIIDKTFSYEKWNRAMGSKNRTYLQLLVSGKRKVNDEYREKFLGYFAFNRDEKNHFEDLVDVTQVRSAEQKKQLKNRIVKRIYRGNIHTVRNSVEYFKNAKMLALHALLSYDDVNTTPAVLGQFLQESESKIEGMLAKLNDLGLAVRTENGLWKSTHRSLMVRPSQGAEGHDAMREIHLSYLEQGLEVAKRTTGKESRHQGYMVMLTEEELVKIHHKAREYVHGLVQEFETLNLENRKPYHWQWVIFPILK